MSHQAVWLSKDIQVSLRSVEKWTPGKGEALIEVQYSGINPADIKHAFAGFSDCIAGYDFAGTIVELGEGANPAWKVGDKVCGFGAPMLKKPPQYGSHQRYHVARHFVHNVPAGVPLEDAAAMPVVVQTAADALFNQIGLTLGSKHQEAVLIWGGAGSVGLCAIQLAKAAGCYPIVTTASAKNHETLLSLGADKVFDYHDKDIQSQISSYMKGEKFSHIFDAVVGKGDEHTPSSTSVCEALAASDAKFAAAIPAAEPKKEWNRVFACRNTDIDFVLPGGRTLSHKAEPAWQEKMTEAFVWALEHYGKGKGFVLPNVRVVKGGEQALEALRYSAAGKASLEKLVIAHPL